MGPYVPPCCCWYVVPRSWTSSIFNEEISCLFRVAGWSCSLMFQQIGDAINLPENTKKTLHCQNCKINFRKGKTFNLVVNLLFSHNRFSLLAKTEEKAKKHLTQCFAAQAPTLPAGLGMDGKKFHTIFIAKKWHEKAGLKLLSLLFYTLNACYFYFPDLNLLYFPKKTSYWEYWNSRNTGNRLLNLIIVDILHKGNTHSWLANSTN